MSDLQSKLKKIQQDKSKDNEIFNDDHLEEMIQMTIQQSYNNKDSYYNPNVLDSILPDCYKNINFDKLSFDKFIDETLFYIFYTFCKSDLQIKVYRELIKRGYFYSKILQAFIFSEDLKLDNLMHNIIVFDPFTWTRVTKEIFFDDKFINSIEK